MDWHDNKKNFAQRKNLNISKRKIDTTLKTKTCCRRPQIIHAMHCRLSIFINFKASFSAVTFLVVNTLYTWRRNLIHSETTDRFSSAFSAPTFYLYLCVVFCIFVRICVCIWVRIYICSWGRQLIHLKTTDGFSSALSLSAQTLMKDQKLFAGLPCPKDGWNHAMKLWNRNSWDLQLLKPLTIYYCGCAFVLESFQV